MEFLWTVIADYMFCNDVVPNTFNKSEFIASKRSVGFVPSAGNNKKILGITVLCITAPFGLIVMCYGQIFNSIVALAINTYYTGKLINVGFIRQMKDLFPTILLSLTMFGTILLVNGLIESNMYRLIIGIMVGIVVYVSGSYIFKFKELQTLFSLIRRK